MSSSTWWATRVGEAAAATTSSTQPQPNYGAAFDIALAGMTESQRQALLNSMQTVSEDEAAQQQAMLAAQQAVQAEADEDDSAWDKIRGGVGSFLGGVGDALGSVKGGLAAANDWQADLLGYGDAQDKAQERSREALDQAGEFYEENIAEPVERGISTVIQTGNIIDERGFTKNFSDWLDGNTWKEAWERTDNATFGQSLADVFVDRDLRRQGYEAGFDPETGLPLDENYRQMRTDNTAYNLFSGTADFVQEWFTDPLTLATAGLGRARAFVKGDLDHLGSSTRDDFLRITTAPDEALDTMKIRSWSPAEQRALQLRRQMGELRDRARAGELDTVGLIDEVQAFRNNPAAGAFFQRLSTARKWDADNLAYTDEFDDDLFYHGVGAMMGVPQATEKLRVAFGDQGRGLAERIDNLRETRIPKLDEELDLAQQRYDQAVSEGRWLRGPGALRAQEKTLNAGQALDASRRKADMLKAELEEYEDFNRFTNSVDDRIASAGISMVPRASRSFSDVITETASHTYRSPGTGRTHTYVKYPVAAFRERPGVMDLSRNIHGQVDNYLNQVAAYGREGVESMGPERFEEMRRIYLNRAADATTDVERRRIAADMETRGVEVIAAKYGLEPGEARQIAVAYSGRRRALFQDIERQAAENRAYSAGDSPLTYKWEQDGGTHEVELPLTLTQLQNYFLPMDLRAFDQLLSQHGEAIKAFARAKNTTKNWAGDFAGYFEAWWKPAVLLRGGYIVRNVSDESLRAVAALDTVGTLLKDIPQALTIGTANLPIRAVNRIKGAGNRAARRRWQKRLDQEAPVLRGPAESLQEDAGRLKAVTRNVAPIERWSQDLLRNRANGVKDPKAPAIVQKLRLADEAAGGGSFALDMANGRRLRSVDSVVPIGDEIVLDSLDEVAIARFAEVRAGLLSHPDGVLLVRKTPDGVVVNVGRRGAKYLKKSELIPQIGAKPTTLRGRKGASWQATGAFEQGVGDIYRSVNSSGISHQSMTTSYEGQVANLRAMVDQGKRSVVGDVNHADTWLTTINNQLRPDPAVRARLEGKELKDWLNTPEGREVKRRIPWRAADPYTWQTELDNHLNALLPTDRLRAIVRSDEPLTAEDLQQIIDSRREVVPKAVDTTAVDMTLGQGVGRALNNVKDKIYNAIATVPSDVLVRNPFFNRMYKHRLQQAVDQLDAGTVISRESQAVMERQAREYALRQTRRYMFNAMDHTDLNHSLRFMSSFMNAWQDTLVKWGRIIMERPEQFVRLYVNGWQNIDKLPFVEFVDSNGLGKDDPEHGELTNIRMPAAGLTMKFFDKILPGDQSAAAKVFETWNINKNGLNSIIQGSPWWLPGSSPFIQVPAAYMLKDSPHLADDSAFSSFMYKYLFPAGVPGQPILDTLLPAAWMTQVRRQLQGVEDPVFNQMVLTRTRQELYQEWVDSGKQGPPPTDEEAIVIAEGAQAFNIFARFFSPAGFTTETKSQFFFDLANRIQAEHGYGPEAYQRFVDEVGADYYAIWQSTSQSNTGVPATSAGFTQQQKYQKLVEENPELGLAIVGLDAETDEFNYSVYQWQRNTSVSSVDSRKQRAPRGGDGTIAAAEEAEGWRRWNAWNTKIDAELSARGLYSTRQAGAEDLAVLKRQIADQLMAELPGWATAYTSFDTDKTYEMVRSMEKLIEDGDAPERPDWHGIEEFLEIHRAFGAELDSRSLIGGSRDITANSNADLMLAYDYAVGELKQRNLMFAELYDRMLSNHQLTLGSGGV